MNTLNHPGAPRRRQQGGIAVFAAIGIGVLVSMLALLDIGFMYHYKREYQKAADLAAMAGASQLDEGCDEARAMAVASAEANLTIHWSRDEFVKSGVQCGTWYARDFRSSEGPDASAVHVVIRGTAPRFLLPVNRPLAATAIASSGDPVAAFSVGTRLARLDGNSIVGDTLQMIGLNPEQVDVMGYNGLVDAVVTPRGLLAALGIPVSANLTAAGLNQLLSVRTLSLERVLDAVLMASGRDEEYLLNLNTSVLSLLSTALEIDPVEGIVLSLGSTSGQRGLFAPIEAEGASALDVSVNALDLLSTAIMVASSRRGIDIETTRLNIPGLGTVTLKAGVIEPPAIGIGGPGTKAYSAQARIFAHIDLSTSNFAGGLLDILQTQVMVNIPITIDVASATGTLSDLCSVDLRDESFPECPLGENCAVVGVDVQVAKMCLGSIPDPLMFSDKASCDLVVNNDADFRVRVAGINVINLGEGDFNQSHDHIFFSVDPLTLAAGYSKDVNGELVPGDSIRDLIDAFLVGALASGVVSSSRMDASQRRELAQNVWNDMYDHPCSGLVTAPLCRIKRLNDARDALEESIEGLNLFMSLIGGDNSLVGTLLSLDVLDVLRVFNNTVGGLLGGVWDDVACATSENQCVNRLSDSLNQQHVSDGRSINSGNVFLMALLLPALQDLLNNVSNEVLMPLINRVLGLHIGQADVSVMDIQCRDGAHLVH